MLPDVTQLSAFGGSIALGVLVSSPVLAQVIPDRTLPSNSVVPRNCVVCEISGGTRAGRNLFHSFEQFSIPTGGVASFNNPANVQNIFTRVTGSLPSDINGVIQASSSANLFLINPNGIVFGPNASLDIRGSFLATTAHSITFSDGTDFSATNPQASSLLTVNVPSGLQFGQNSGSIVNHSQADPGGATNTLGAPVGLQVQTGQSLTFLGNRIVLENGNLTARGGRIELGSVREGFVRLAPQTTYSTNQSFGDIQLSNSSFIDTSGENGGRGSGGIIRLQGRDISLTNNSTINSTTYRGTGEDLQILASNSLILNASSAGTFAEREGNAGDVLIQADNFLELSGLPPSSLGSQVLRDATGNAGNIEVDTGFLLIQNGSRIEASSFGGGGGGNIHVQASTIEIIGFNLGLYIDSNIIYKRGRATSGIISQVQGLQEDAEADVGNAGNIEIETNHLLLLNGGFISSATFTSGNGGTLTVDADVIQVRGASPVANFDTNTGLTRGRSGIFVSAEPTRQGVAPIGDVGDLRINANQFTVADRGEISANNSGSGQGGTIAIDVNQLFVQDGGEIRGSSLNRGDGGTLTINARELIDISGSGTIGSINFPSAIAALATSSGNAGDVRITTDSLNVENGAEISVSGEGQGAAGNLDIQADVIHLNQGNLFAETQQGSGANIQLQGNLLLMQNGSLVSARASERADGGDVTITMPNGFVVAGLDEDNDIIANANEGQGGNISISAQSIIGLEERRDTLANSTNDIDASSEFGAPGSVTINQPDVDPSRGLSELPSDLVDASNLVAQPCSTGGTVARERGEFIITGRSGLPPSPTAPRGTSLPPREWATLEEELQIEQSALELGTLVQNPEGAEELWNYEDEIVEAQGWMVGEQGEIILVAEAPASPQVSTTNLNCNTVLGN
jgi:filamentous hemagglutinin family protein